MTPTSAHRDWRTPTVVLVATGLILMLSMGIRHGFGLFLQPMTSDHGWGRETFALAMAREAASAGIQVNVVAPNYLYSEMYYPRARFIDDPKGRDFIAGIVPMGPARHARGNRLGRRLACRRGLRLHHWRRFQLQRRLAHGLKRPSYVDKGRLRAPFLLALRCRR
jgi:hypothetical protein